MQPESPEWSAATAPVRVAQSWDWPAIALWLTRALFIVLIGLGLVAPVQRTGDAHQYHAMAGALANLKPPALTPPEVVAYKAWLNSQAVDSMFPSAARAVEQPVLVVGDRQEFSHFWLFPLLAAPFVAIVQALGLHPGYGFFAVNSLLLGGALWSIQRATRPIVGLLLIASPAVWFINKAQVELFTFAVLALAMVAAVRGRFALAALVAALAATQNLPILAAVPCFWAAGLLRWWLGRRATSGAADPAVLPNMRSEARPSDQLVTTGVLVLLTLAIGALHPLYYLWRVGVITPQQLNGGIGLGAPSLSRYLAVLIDPDIGLLWWVPLIAMISVIGVIGLVWPTHDPELHDRPPSWLDLRLAAGCAVIVGTWLLFAFARTTNVNSGGTVYMSRYAMWLLPLMLPFLIAAADWWRPRLPALLPVLGALAFIFYAVAFRPSRHEEYITPSPQANWLNDWFPGFYKQVPEIFYERHHAVDGGVRGSAANQGCTVILLHAALPEQPCALAIGERTAADHLFATGWRVVWIIRPGRLGLGSAGVTGAERGGA